MQEAKQESGIKLPGNQLIQVEDYPFTYDGFQVVRGEFFAHIYEPAVIFNKGKVYVNSTSLNRLPEVEYVHFLVNSRERKLLIKPCKESDRDSLHWCTSSRGKRKPKQITAKVFWAKIIQLMDWNPLFRYKLIGKLVRCEKELVLAFDLSCVEIYQRRITEDEKEIASRKPTYPAEWQNDFGIPYKEHKRQLQINIFDGYAVFTMDDIQSESITEAANGTTDK